jgi:hypothetical protein
MRPTRLFSGILAGLSVIAYATLSGGLAPAKADTCVAKALEEVRRVSPDGYAVYQRLRNKEDFTRWIKCDNLQLALTTAVHEGVHLLSDQVNGYPLINGQVLPRVTQRRGFFPPRFLAQKFNAKSSFVETYLTPGHASSADEFEYLLDEFNAYTHDLHTAIRVRHLAPPSETAFHRDGPAALMAFVAEYLEKARQENGEAWRALQDPQVRRVVNTLWAQAEDVMGASCRTPDYALDTPEFLTPVCSANINHGLGQMLGRPPLCPVACLNKQPRKVRSSQGRQMLR